MTRTNNIAWPRIRATYEENRIPVRALARMYGISDTAIHKKAATEDWPRKPAPDQTRRGSPSANPSRAVTGGPAKRKDAGPLEAVASSSALTIKSATLVRQGRAIVEGLMRELKETTQHYGTIEELIVNETSEDTDGRRRQAMLKAISLPSRSLTAKHLALAIRALSQRNASTPLTKKEQLEARAEYLSKHGRFRSR